jgi:hypothetical protein
VLIASILVQLGFDVTDCNPAKLVSAELLKTML